jgi:urease accessory protein
MRALLAALWQSDAAFPSGGFAFSNGVEAAAATLPRFNRATLAELISVTLARRWATTERLAMLRAFHAADLARLNAIDAAYEAATLCEPLRLGSRRNGRAFLTAHRRLGSPGAADFEAEIAASRAFGHMAVAQGFIWRGLGLGQAEAVAASAYTTAAGMANAAVRLGALGALEAQGALSDALAEIERLAQAPFDLDEPFSSAAIWLDVVAARHARAHLRLFAN